MWSLVFLLFVGIGLVVLHRSRNRKLTAEESTQLRTEEYGKLKIQDDCLVREFKNEVKFQIPISDIKVIGEYTNANGPVLDDWFLTIVTEDFVYDIPHYTIGVDEVLDGLRKRLDAPLPLQFANSTDWKTRIIYPTNLLDHELYDLKEVEPQTTWDRVRKLAGIPKMTAPLTDEILELLKK